MKSIKFFAVIGVSVSLYDVLGGIEECNEKVQVTMNIWYRKKKEFKKNRYMVKYTRGKPHRVRTKINGFIVDVLEKSFNCG